MNIEKIQHFISEAHQSIDGWFFPLDQLIFFELASLQNRLNITGDMCEIGVWKGKSLTLLSLLKAKEERLFGFDLFVDDHQALTEANLAQFGCSDNVILKKGLTSDIGAANLDAMFETALRFLHIDAGHEYHEVLEQLELFVPLASDQAVISMDDYQDREFPGIEAAVLDFAERDRPRRFVPFVAGGNKMYLCTEPLAATLQRLIVHLPNFKDSCRLTRVRDFNIVVLKSKLPVASDKIVSQIDATNFPRRPDHSLSLNEKSSLYSQLAYGSGEMSGDQK